MTLDLILHKISVKTNGWTAMDLTEDIQRIVYEKKLKHGVVIVFTPSKNVVVTTIEYEPQLLGDLESLIKKLGGPSSIVEALIGKTTTIPVVNSNLETGTYKRIVLIDLSNEPGDKEVIIVLEGIYH